MQICGFSRSLTKFNGEMGFGGWNIGSFTKVVWFLAFSYEIGTGLQTFTISRYNSLFDRIVFRCNNHWWAPSLIYPWLWRFQTDFNASNQICFVWYLCITFNTSCRMILEIEFVLAIIINNWGIFQFINYLIIF